MGVIPKSPPSPPRFLTSKFKRGETVRCRYLTGFICEIDEDVKYIGRSFIYHVTAQQYPNYSLWVDEDTLSRPDIFKELIKKALTSEEILR
jgi:hypothetical protein